MNSAANRVFPDLPLAGSGLAWRTFPSAYHLMKSIVLVPTEKIDDYEQYKERHNDHSHDLENRPHIRRV